MTARRIRADLRAVQEHLADSPDEAARMLMAGVIRGPEGRSVKPGEEVLPGSLLIHDKNWRDVGRGARKGRKAFALFSDHINKQICMDIGASTGGFTQLLLQMGAARVFAVDVGRGLLAHKLQQDPGVVNCEGHNFRHAPPQGVAGNISFACADVSFCSLLHMTASLKKSLRSGGQALLLVKPQFELPSRQVPRGGVVTKPEDRLQAVCKVWGACQEAGFVVHGLWPAACTGRKGNQEYFLCVTLP